MNVTRLGTHQACAVRVALGTFRKVFGADSLSLVVPRATTDLIVKELLLGCT
ncbi:unnamed protein product, partial [Effrenium voratum]